MSKVLFKKIKNIHNSNVVINGITVLPNAYVHICKNPIFYEKFMSDITTLYTQNLISIYDNNDNIISSNDVWDSIDHNIQIANIYANDVSLNPVIINETITLSGYEKDVICNANDVIILTLPPINTLKLCKQLNIKNLSTKLVSIVTANNDTLDNSLDRATQITSLKSISLQPNNNLNSWLIISANNNDNTFIYTQPTASTTWGPITNPFGRACAVDIIDSVGNEFECDVVHNSDFSSIIINLSQPMSGKAILN